MLYPISTPTDQSLRGHGEARLLPPQRASPPACALRGYGTILTSPHYGCVLPHTHMHYALNARPYSFHISLHRSAKTLGQCTRIYLLPAQRRCASSPRARCVGLGKVCALPNLAALCSVIASRILYYLRYALSGFTKLQEIPF
ncbi:hypothetical protein HYPSUDRAFT_1055654 [Hypholoma sublateritium FD-334 SS-4]|uniref:Uncharacterized protein n=1 Tax=Hypholoma sublateritium (strain FD-334 SS-4) TaxID=945553 RepID=A0A0D2NCM5_HYPSF|nr:hypothetical protein HYPSUDRAFT_1055654 [Hypholoma sublateritium FD-334 SS-4]